MLSKKIIRILLCVLVVLGILKFGINFYRTVIPHPAGDWDAAHFWIPRAAALYNGDWNSAMTYWHPDYPPMYSMLLIAGWKLYGRIVFGVPIILSLLLAIGIIIIVYDYVRRASGTSAAMLTVVASFMSAITYFAPSLSADVPFAFFMLLSCYSYLRYNDHRSFSWLVIMTLAAGCALNIKNEGALFLLLFVAATFYLKALSYEDWLKFCMLMSPFIALFVGWHLLTPANDLIAGQTASVVDKLLDITRYEMIAKFYANYYLAVGIVVIVLAVLAYILGESNERSEKYRIFSLLIVLGMLSGYFVIYLTTPHDLFWHLATSMDRLMLHVWSFVLIMVSIPVRIDIPALDKYRDLIVKYATKELSNN